MNLIKLFNYFQWCTERADGIVFNLPSPSVWSRNFQWKTEKKQQRRKAEEGRKKWRKKRQRRCWAVRGGLRSWKTVKPFTSCAQQAREIFYRTRTENQIKRLSSYRESGRRAECQREPNINIRGDRHRCFVLFFFFSVESVLAWLLETISRNRVSVCARAEFWQSERKKRVKRWS